MLITLLDSVMVTKKSLFGGRTYFIEQLLFVLIIWNKEAVLPNHYHVLGNYSLLSSKTKGKNSIFIGSNFIDHTTFE